MPVPIHGALLNRRMQFGALAIIDSIAAVGGLVFSVAFAILSESFWALYVGSLVATLVPTLGYWLVSRWRPSWPSRKSGAGALMAFGANVTGFNIANFFARNLDKVLIGKYWGDQPLGLYDRAYKLLLLPIQQINAPVSRIMLPVLSRIRDDDARYRRAYLRAVSQTMNYSLPLVAFLVGTCDLLVARRVYGFLGMLRPYKGVEELVDVFSRIEDPSSRLLIAGEPIDKAYARRLLQHTSADRRIVLLSAKFSEREFSEFYAVADVIVLPMRDYLHSGSLLRAVSEGRPLVTRDTPFARAVGREVGEGWITTYPRQLDVQALLDCRTPREPPCLQSFTPERLGERACAFYRALGKLRKP